MTTTLENTILVLLGARSGTAYELHQRHTEIFGDDHRVDLQRVLGAVTRLERSGHITLRAPRPDVQRNRPLCTLTMAGRRRQRQWLMGIDAATSGNDIYLRGLLAVEAADPETFEAYVHNSLVTVRQQQRSATTLAGLFGAERARTAFELERARALTLWLHGLAAHRDPVAACG
ncbi:hypothetical protein [Dactylosporangium sp. NPDC005555]|uniref:hypothetical protein n=1 Tax=Dactylosporangium sp. NPDC005555 TaxID=3154889 RepID=UPI0033AE89F3